VKERLHSCRKERSQVASLFWRARSAVSVNETADALGTQVAVRLGISSNRESAGNRVARLSPKDVCRELESAGFRAQALRYLMYYKHEPGHVMQFASRPGVYHLYRRAMEMANLGIGRWGNKLQVTAVRAG
jgi:hypothetical protein